MRIDKILSHPDVLLDVVVHILGGGILVLPTSVYLRALKAGKRWKREQAMKETLKDER